MNPPRISLDDVRHVARLARLALDESELQRLAGQIEPIIDYVAKIAQADVHGVEPMAHAADLKNVLRPDEVGPCLPLEQVLRNAPDTEGPFFKVPKIIADDDSAG